MTTQPAEHPAEADARHAVDVAEAALAVAGHEVDDEMRAIGLRVARGEITVGQAQRLAAHRYTG